LLGPPLFLGIFRNIAATVFSLPTAVLCTIDRTTRLSLSLKIPAYRAFYAQIYLRVLPTQKISSKPLLKPPAYSYNISIMMKKYFILALFCLALFPAGLKAETLLGVEPGTPKAMVTDQLGDPTLSELVKNRQYFYYQEVYGPDSLVIVELDADTQRVASMMAQSTNSQVITDKGVTVGSLVNQVTFLYGQPIRTEKTLFSDADAYYYFYQVKSRTGDLQDLYFIFSQRQDTVQAIILESPDDDL